MMALPPTELFTALEPRINFFEIQKVCRMADFEALKMWLVRSGHYLDCIYLYICVRLFYLLLHPIFPSFKHHLSIYSLLALVILPNLWCKPIAILVVLLLLTIDLTNWPNLYKYYYSRVVIPTSYFVCLRAVCELFHSCKLSLACREW